MKKTFAAVFLTVFFLASCAKVSITGREQFNLLSDQDVAKQANEY
jgi:hypothetical protein